MEEGKWRLVNDGGEWRRITGGGEWIDGGVMGMGVGVGGAVIGSKNGSLGLVEG